MGERGGKDDLSVDDSATRRGCRRISASVFARRKVEHASHENPSLAGTE